MSWFNDEVWGLAGLPDPSASIIKLLLSSTNLPGSNLPLASEARSAASGHTQALLRLRHLPTAELDRLLRETLDLASHRLDAWVTAFATRRVTAMRHNQEKANKALPHGEEVPVGTFFGGYGWVEDLRPASHTVKAAPDGKPADVDLTNGGFIHAPSSRHAMAAAVMRSGYLTFSKEDPQKLAFDLSSRQVRSGLQVLDEVRNGQHLGEVLGYAFERGLQEGHPGVAGLNALRFTFRNLFPLVAGKNGVDTSQPADRVAARNVVDGLQLYRAYKTGSLQFTGNPLPAPGTAGHKAVIAELDKLGQMLDEVADLLVGEGIFQLAGGNVEGALPSMNNLVRGNRPPNPGIAQSPRAGRGLAHRIAYVFQDPQPTLSPNWPATPSARAGAEPVLNAWLGSLVGDPANVSATVIFDENGATTQKTITLSQLSIHPLDLLALARAALQPGQAGLLDARLVVAALGDDTSKTNVRVDHAPQPGRDANVSRTFPEIVELLGTLGAALGASRALGLEDLVSPTDLPTAIPAAETAALENVKELEARASAAVEASSGTNGIANTLLSALTALDPDVPTTVENLRAALRIAAQIAVEQAFAPCGASADDLAARATAVLRELARRKMLIDALPPPFVGETSKSRMARAMDTLKALFGSDMLVLPQLTPPGADELKQALAGRSTSPWGGAPYSNSCRGPGTRDRSWRRLASLPSMRMRWGPACHVRMSCNCRSYPARRGWRSPLRAS